jgi:predicted metal-dependent peptidase
MNADLMEQIKKWRRGVCRAIPAFDAILYAATYEEDESIGTIGINNDTLKIKVNPKFVAAQKDADNTFILAHEAAHFLCDHLRRGQAMKRQEGDDYRHDLYSTAAEHAVNALVESLSGWSTPSGGVKPEEVWKMLSTEEIYKELKKDPANKLPPVLCLCGGDGKDGEGEPQSGVAQMIAEQAREAATKTLQEGVGGQPPGDQVGELRQLLLDRMGLTKPPDWRRQLARYLTALDTNCKHFDVRSIYRRAMCDGRNMVLPNLASDTIARRFALSLDNSGSVCDEMFSQILGTVHSATQQLGFKELYVYHFTCAIIKRLRLTTASQIKKITREGSGGTDIHEVDRQAKQDACMFNIIVTDGYVEWLSRYAVPTLVVLTVEDVESPPKVHNLIGVVHVS